MNKKTKSEDYFEKVCKNALLLFERIPKSQEKSADYILRTNGEKAIVEVKEKEDDILKRKKFDQTLEAGDIAEHEETISPKKSIRNILDDAAEQIKASSETGNEFKIIWFHGIGIDNDAQCSQAIYTAYGTTDLMHFIPGEPFDNYTCHYFDFNFFFDNPQISCLIVTNGQNQLMCINNFFKQQEDFMKSRIFIKLSSICDVFDPLKEESKENKLLVADCKISRSNEKALFKYLNEKYELSIQNKMPMTRYTAKLRKNSS